MAEASASFLKCLEISQSYMPIIPALGRLRQEDGKFNANLGCKNNEMP
jgi:hypothetical protein